MQFDKGFDEGQAESEAAAAELELAGGMARHVKGGEKRLANVWQARRVDADATIADLDFDATVRLPPGG